MLFTHTHTHTHTQVDADTRTVMLRLYLYLVLISQRSRTSEQSRVLKKKPKTKPKGKAKQIDSNCDLLKMPHLGELQVIDSNGDQYQYENRTNSDRFIVFMQVRVDDMPHEQFTATHLFRVHKNNNLECARGIDVVCTSVGLAPEHKLCRYRPFSCLSFVLRWRHDFDRDVVCACIKIAFGSCNECVQPNCSTKMETIVCADAHECTYSRTQSWQVRWAISLSAKDQQERKAADISKPENLGALVLDSGLNCFWNPLQFPSISWYTGVRASCRFGKVFSRRPVNKDGISTRGSKILVEKQNNRFATSYLQKLHKTKASLKVNDQNSSAWQWSLCICCDARAWLYDLPLLQLLKRAHVCFLTPSRSSACGEPTSLTRPSRSGTRATWCQHVTPNTR